MASGLITRRLLISGRVQGVRFRASMVEAAAALRISGWVRNRSDGTVEALVQGAPQDVEQIIAWAGQGPARAHVTGVAVSDAACGPLHGFERRQTL